MAKTHIFKFKKGFFLLCFVFFILCCALGIWQLQRYQFKKNLFASYHTRMNGIAKPFREVVTSSQREFQKTNVKGFYRNDLTVLIQNRFYHDKLGYEVLTPLQIKNDSHFLLVDRGWIPTENIKTLAMINGPQNLTGYIKEMNEYQFILGNSIVGFGKPMLMQKIDINALSQYLHAPFYPFVLRLTNQDKIFVRDWTLSAVPPARHLGYAIQWFLFAVILVIGYIAFCFEKVNEKL